MARFQRSRDAQRLATIRELAVVIRRELETALADREDVRHGHETLRLRLRRLLDETESVPEPFRKARRMMLHAIGRSEAGDQRRRCGS